jgi:hypothetical protein
MLAEAEALGAVGAGPIVDLLIAERRCLPKLVLRVSAGTRPEAVPLETISGCSMSVLWGDCDLTEGVKSTD